MKTVPQIIDELGGSTVVASLLGVPASTTVASWKSRKSIPVEHWQKLLDAARAKDVADVSYENLVRLHSVAPDAVSAA